MNFHSQGFHGLLGEAPVAVPAAAAAPGDFGSAADHERGPGEPAPPRVPARDILVIGRPAVLSVEQKPPVRVVPRISRARLALRLALVAALIGETVFTVKSWPTKPVAVPDVSDSRSVIV